MKKPLNLSNSIYQQQGSGMGLTVKDGMLINNRPDGVTGIKQVCELKKMMKRAEKVSMYAEAMTISNPMGGYCH